MGTTSHRPPVLLLLVVGALLGVAMGALGPTVLDTLAAASPSGLGVLAVAGTLVLVVVGALDLLGLVTAAHRLGDAGSSDEVDR